MVRVRSSEPSLKAWVFGGAGENYAVPIPASGEKGKQFKDHVKEILIQDRFHHSLDNCFIISSDEMPRFCWAFVMKSDKSYEFLTLFTLAVEIRQDLNGSNLHKKAYMDTQKKTFEGDAHAENEVEFEDSAALGGIARSNAILHRLLDTTSISTTGLACMKSSSARGYKRVATFLTFMYGMTNLVTSDHPAIDSEPSPSLTLLRLHESRMRQQNKHTKLEAQSLVIQYRPRNIHHPQSHSIHIN